MKAAARRLVYSLHHPISRDRVFRDRKNPLAMYDDIDLFQCFRFPRRNLLEVIDDFEDDVPFKLKPFSSSSFSPFSSLSTVWGSLPVAFKASVILASV